jgi:hypothetical protein
MAEEVVIEEHAYPTPGSLWRHFRGGLYRVVCVAVREHDHREQVVYEPADGAGPVWVRDLLQWNMKVTPKEGEKVPRFSPVGEPQPDRVEFVDSNPCGRPIEDRGPEY